MRASGWIAKLSACAAASGGLFLSPVAPAAAADAAAGHYPERPIRLIVAQASARKT